MQIKALYKLMLIENLKKKRANGVDSDEAGHYDEPPHLHHRCLQTLLFHCRLQ